MEIGLKKRTFLGLDVTPRWELWFEIEQLVKRVDSLECIAGRATADRERVYTQVHELQDKIRRTNQPRNKGRFAKKR